MLSPPTPYYWGSEPYWGGGGGGASGGNAEGGWAQAAAQWALPGGSYGYNYTATAEGDESGIREDCGTEQWEEEEEGEGGEDEECTLELSEEAAVLLCGPPTEPLSMEDEEEFAQDSLPSHTTLPHHPTTKTSTETTKTEASPHPGTREHPPYGGTRQTVINLLQQTLDAMCDTALQQRRPIMWPVVALRQKKP
ncbi:hypothetical protein Pelo_9996 [Pelomyxa schiedti]|nr:hypothetical protein Pelo_9996 [Pelomyxa schiedti]